MKEAVEGVEEAEEGVEEEEGEEEEVSAEMKVQLSLGQPIEHFSCQREAETGCLKVFLGNLRGLSVYLHFE